MLVKNESQLDRALRLILGVVLLAIGYSLVGWWSIVLYLLAIYALLTAATGTCYLYRLFKLDTAETTLAKSEVKPEEVKPEVKTEVKPDEMEPDTQAAMPETQPETEVPTNVVPEAAPETDAAEEIKPE